MKIAYCSLIYPKEKKIAERTKARLSGISNHKVTVAEVTGIDNNLGKPIDLFNIINAVNYPLFPQLIFKNEEWNHSSHENHTDYHIGYINFVGIKYITQYLGMKKKLKKWCAEDDEKKIICVHHSYLPNMMAAVKIKKIFKDKIIICLNTGDIPGQYGLKSQKKKTLKQFLIENVVEKNIMKLAKKFDCFVFVTDDMAKGFEVEEKPYCVVECAYNGEKKEYCRPTVNKEKMIFYAGAIREEYGIIHLLEAFSLIKDPNYRLVLAGGGDAEEDVKAYAEKDKRITFLGFISPQKVYELQMKSTILVSPRQSHYEYVKYSFPSKSLDCLASGVPYVAHRLPCDPQEYEEVINYAEDETDFALAKKMKEICELSDDERFELGKKAQEFVWEKKNADVMTKKIIDMWKGV